MTEDQLALTVPLLSLMILSSWGVVQFRSKHKVVSGIFAFAFSFFLGAVWQLHPILHILTGIGMPIALFYAWGWVEEERDRRRQERKEYIRPRR